MNYPLTFALLSLLASAVQAMPLPEHAARTLGDVQVAPAQDALAPLAIALAKSDSSAVETALEDPHLPAWIALWMRGRREADASVAMETLERAAERWRLHIDANEPDLAARLLDHDRAHFAFDAKGREGLRAVLAEPVGLHRSDSVWAAYVALATDGDKERARSMRRAWSAAEPLERRNRVFAWHAELLRHDDDGDTADAWLEYVEGLRTSAQRRFALDFWDEHTELREAVEVEGTRARLVRWLARNVRRSEALEVALRGAASDDEEDASDCFMGVAEQYYRLRRHAELLAWLKRERPEGLSAEDRASLDAYPWGVRRRGEAANAELASGFDQVVRDHEGTARAAEALWEAAWMWELSDELEKAVARFERYARENPGGSFAQDAAARAIFLQVRQGEIDAALRMLDEFEDVLGNSHAAAAALWIGGNAAIQLSKDEKSAAFFAQLEEEHGYGPFRRPPPLPLMPEVVGDEEAPASSASEMIRAQQRAFTRIAQALDTKLGGDQSESLRAIEWLFEHGLHEEGDERLSSYAWSQRRSLRMQLACVHLAWRMGRAEQQARIGWRLRQALHGRNAELDRDLDICAYPTPFLSDVSAAARREGIPVGLLYALMRRESFFDPAVVSLAGAYGLLQLMPSTADRMAQDLGDPPPQPDQLRQPLLNLRYGAHYLRRLLDEMAGNPYMALAAYNAGESNGERWWARLREGEPPETFLLLISYSETRAYVYHVLRYWSVYGETHPLLGHPEVRRSR